MSSKIIAGTTSGTALNFSADTSGQLELQTGGSVPVTAVTIDTGGFVNIGTTSTTGKLEVSNANEAISRLTSTGASGRQYELISTGGATGLNTGSLYFYDRTSAAPRASINSTGNFLVNNKLLVGTSGTGGQLAVQGNASVAQDIRTTDSSDVMFVVANTGGSSGSAIYVMPCRFGSTQTFGGGVYWTGSVMQYTGTSDARLKENIVDSTSGLEKLANVKVRSFDWKESGSHVDFGVIAQELEEVAPEAVAKGKDNEDGTIDTPYAVDTSILVPAMIKAIQELNAKVTALEAQLGAK